MMFGSYDREYAQWSPGNAILSEIIQDSLIRGYSCLEFGGEYLEYKKLWTKEFTCSYQLRIYGSSPQATVKKWIQKHLKK
jgi:CelD/BcsL family acetyltransferase involved in cellulose biosynthesis